MSHGVIRDDLDGHYHELERLYREGDPRCAVLRKIDMETIRHRRLADALLACYSDNPGHYRGDELWCPPTQWLNDIHYAALCELALDNHEDLAMMPALKTAADQFYGIDLLATYRDPQTGRVELLTLDISFRQKQWFKADILVTEAGATANPDYYDLPQVHVPHLSGGSATEEQTRRNERRTDIGKLIAHVINEKVENGDPNYGGVMSRIHRRIRQQVGKLLHE